MAVNANDLTDVASLINYSQGQIGGDSSSQILAQSIITAVSYKIQTLTNNMFVRNTYVEFQNTFGRQLRGETLNTPLISIESLRWGYGNCMMIRYTGTAVAASTSITEVDPDTGLRYLNLRTIDATGSHMTKLGISDYALDVTAYQKVSDLVTAVNNISGFEATLQNGFDVPTRWLFPMSSPLKAGNTTGLAYVGYPYVDVFNYQFNKNGTFGYSLMGSWDYFFDSQSAAAYQLHFPGLFQGLLVEYTAGCSVIPPDIKMLANELSLNQYLMAATNPLIKSETMRNYNYVLNTDVWNTEYVANKIFPYKKLALSGGLA